jgi:hypothetical protein
VILSVYIRQSTPQTGRDLHRGLPRRLRDDYADALLRGLWPRIFGTRLPPHTQPTGSRLTDGTHLAVSPKAPPPGRATVEGIKRWTRSTTMP